jgi:2-oxoglutarate ferredoxin oxidoreductase subunit alpha
VLSEEARMESFSVLLGGAAGDGISEAGGMVAQILNRLGYRTYRHIDSPSLIRGGHTFVLVRAHRQRISAHRDHVNVLVALDGQTVERHAWRLKDGAVTVFDGDAVTRDDLPERVASHCVGIPVKSILADLEAPPVMRNTVILGALCRILAIPWVVLDDTITKRQQKQTELNRAVARRSYDLGTEQAAIHPPGGPPLPIVSGVEAMGLGLLSGGLGAYLGYPMTPTSGLLHFLAQQAPRFGVKVYQPEGEIAVMLMALGHAYAGERVAVGTSGGGFCLMTEGLSLAGQAELPIVVVLGQRTGPSTGLPTYTAQGDLDFALSAGHGEFPRVVIAPGDVEQAFAWSRLALDLAWAYQLPVIVLGDRTLQENWQSFLGDETPVLPRFPAREWDGVAASDEPDLAYLRYAFTPDGVSPLAFPGREGAVVKANGYTHDEWGATSEEAGLTARMQEKWLLKERTMSAALDDVPSVNLYGDASAAQTVVTWGSPVGALREIGELLSVRVVQVVVLRPFPLRQLREAIADSQRVAVAEVNASGQLADLMERHGLPVHVRLNRYDGRPWGVGELRRRVEEEVLA